MESHEYFHITPLDEALKTAGLKKDDWESDEKTDKYKVGDYINAFGIVVADEEYYSPYVPTKN